MTPIRLFLVAVAAAWFALPQTARAIVITIDNGSLDSDGIAQFTASWGSFVEEDTKNTLVTAPSDWINGGEDGPPFEDFSFLQIEYSFGGGVLYNTVSGYLGVLFPVDGRSLTNARISSEPRLDENPETLSLEILGERSFRLTVQMPLEAVPDSAIPLWMTGSVLGALALCAQLRSRDRRNVSPQDATVLSSVAAAAERGRAGTGNDVLELANRRAQ